MVNTPDGRTLVVRNLHHHSLVVSADAICEKQGGVTPACRAGVLLGLADQAIVMARLPHLSVLDAIAGD
jgi:hypothetical protein